MSTMNILGGLTAFMGGLATQAQSREVARNIEFLAESTLQTFWQTPQTKPN